jgi:hypothetical protein
VDDDVWRYVGEPCLARRREERKIRRHSLRVAVAGIAWAVEFTIDVPGREYLLEIRHEPVCDRALAGAIFQQCRIVLECSTTCSRAAEIRALSP